MPDSVYDLLNSANSAYDEKMMHPVPAARVVERELYILERVKDRVVLDIGATGPMHYAIQHLAKVCYGIDIIEKTDPYYFRIDLDHAGSLPTIEGLEIIIAGEVIEHLSNPGHFLDLLRIYDCPIVLTTPNAFSEAGRRSILRGVEQVNREHTCYFSYHTLHVLFERHGYNVEDWCWYNGKPGTAEGLVCLISKRTR